MGIFAQSSFFHQPVGIIEIADMGGGVDQVGFGVVARHLRLGQAVQCAAGDVLDLDAGALGEFLADDLDARLPVAAPGADDQLLLSHGGGRGAGGHDGQGTQCNAQLLHVPPL
ncbi:hypothetical protein ACFSKM_19965 [Ancylobacter dichloromethanicus]